MINRSFGLNEFGFLLFSLQWTVLLTLIALICGGILGFIIACARISRIKWLSLIAFCYIQLIQGIPVLILLFLSFYGLSLLGFSLPPLIAASLSLTIYVSSYLGEIWRGCIQAVPKQQKEAASSLALTTIQQYYYIILPCAFKLSLPSTTGFTVQLIKNTSIVSIIGFVELSRAGQLVNNTIFQPFYVFITVSILYFIICYPISLFSRHLEKTIGNPN